MIVKQRSKPLPLIRLQHFKARTTLTEKDELQYSNLEKGYNGEQTFDEWLKALTADSLVLQDLLFEFNQTHFQIDTLLILSDCLLMFEVKHFSGDFYLKENRWYTSIHTEMKNPLLQLQRNESLLRQLLQHLRVQKPIKGYLIFPNTEFQLYNVPMNLPIIFSTQRKRFVSQLNSNQLNLKTDERKLANIFLAHHIPESPFTHKPSYPYEKLKKGVVCPRCSSFMKTLSTQKVICQCGYTETNQLAISRSIDEYRLLFPERPVTTNSIWEWCKIHQSKRIIQDHLAKNYELIGHSNSSHYVKR
ncbi:nuclease-related domain-containing protein [Bacillus sp. JCM 19034]|uniref:nuclease-related domain-containing protein n=1 Tax=Bacillus sp. JCM 19034 TaxID=1481928 RepID=UPI000783CE86|nr:nuclease-related domain-containing protein [Bacillus sp. JCM 19034]